MYYYHCTVGTETAMGRVTTLRVGATYITVTWPKPKYSPVSVRVDYQYSLFGEKQPYFTNRTYVPAHCNRMDFTRIKPGSVVKVTFAVLYNPSALDRGVNYIFETLRLRKAYGYSLYST